MSAKLSIVSGPGGFATVHATNSVIDHQTSTAFPHREWRVRMNNRLVETHESHKDALIAAYRLTGAAPFSVPNLDDMSIEELAKWRVSIKLRTVFPCPFEGDAAALVRLRSYAKLKIEAIYARSTGAVDSALKREKRCDAIYAQLPKGAQW
jgi:hypothetical protein